MVRAKRKEEGSVPVRFNNYRAGERTSRCTALWGVAAMLQLATEANKQSYEKLLQWHDKQKMEWKCLKENKISYEKLLKEAEKQYLEKMQTVNGLDSHKGVGLCFALTFSYAFFFKQTTYSSLRC